MAGLSFDYESGGPHNHTMAGNVLVAMSPSRRLQIQGENIPGDWNSAENPYGLEFRPGISHGTMTNTTYILSPGLAAAKSGGAAFQDAAAIRAAAPWTDSSPRIVRASALLLINDTEQPHDFTAPTGTWAEASGKPVAKSVTVAPFRSAVLVRASDASGLPPYVLASGIDYRDANGGLGASRVAAKSKAAAKPAKPGAESAPASAPATTPAAAAPAAVSANKPDPAAWKRWVTLLRERTAEAAAGPKPPQYVSGLLRAKVTVLAVDGDQATIKITGGGEMTANLFGRIAPGDASQLARALVRGDEALGHAMAAFFSRCAAETAPYHEHLARAGEHTAEVEAAFTAK
jgi:hypothetical protein